MKETKETLRRLEEEGCRPKLWLRDDDFITDSPNFELIIRSTEYTFPMVFGVVPFRMKLSDKEINSYKKLNGNVYFCVHGYSHMNRSESQPLSEYPCKLSHDQVKKELEYGYKRVKSVFNERFLPIFIPPWNNMCDDFIPELVSTGFKAISSDENVEMNITNESCSLLSINVDILNYGKDIWFPMKTNAEIDNLLAYKLKRVLGIGEEEVNIGILSHHTSMIAKDINRYVGLISDISDVFEPYDILSAVH